MKQKKIVSVKSLRKNKKITEKVSEMFIKIKKEVLKRANFKMEYNAINLKVKQ